MDDLERLERLNRLRESGGLTEAEFEVQKARLFTDAVSPHSRILWIVLVIVGGVILAAAYFALLKPRADVSADNGLGTNATQPVSNSALPKTKAVAAPPPDLAQNSYAWATSSEVLNVNPAFLESRLGPAREKSAGHMLFDIGGCQVSYTIDAGAVRMFYAPIRGHCRPSLAGTPARAIQLSTLTTFGQIERAMRGGEYTAGCLEMCGNAADPTVELTVGGSRADGFIQVAFSSVAAGDHGSLSGLGAWADTVRSRLGLSPRDMLPLEGMSCADNPPPNVVAALRPARIDSVSVGLSTDVSVSCG